MKQSTNLKGIFFLVAAAMIWGFAMVAQKSGMDNLQPLTFTAIRCTLGGLSMIPLILILDRRKSPEQRKAEHDPKTLIKGSVVSGIVITAYILLQQVGVQYTTVGKSGFITALYIILVPVAGIFLKRKVERRVWIAVIIAMAGFYLMCMSEGLSEINKGDILMFLASIGCAIHIYLIDFFVNKIDAVKFSSFQFLFCGIVCSVLAFLFDSPSWEDVIAAAVPILYAGVISCGFGYTCQMLGQKYVEPSKASLIMSSETIFTMVAGMIFFSEIMSIKEYIGCVLIFAAILLSQIEKKGEK